MKESKKNQTNKNKKIFFLFLLYKRRITNKTSYENKFILFHNIFNG